MAAVIRTDMSDEELTDFTRSFVLGNRPGDSEYELDGISVARNRSGVVTVPVDAERQSVFIKTVEDDDSMVPNVGVHCAKIEIEEDGVVELA